MASLRHGTGPVLQVIELSQNYQVKKINFIFYRRFNINICYLVLLIFISSLQFDNIFIMVVTNYDIRHLTRNY